MSLRFKSTEPNKLSRALWLFGHVGFCLLIGYLGSRVTLPEIPGWYAALAKPVWVPPNSWFGPVWTSLYVLMAVAVWLVQGSDETPLRRQAFVLYGLQLALNVLWSPLFFHYHQIAAALVVSALLWLALAFCLRLFWQLHRVAGLLLVPYLAWMSLATALNAALLRLNGA